MLVDQPDQLALHLADQHHADDVHRLGRGHPQAALELGLDAEPVEHRGDLRAAAVHDDRAEPGEPQEHDVLGERRFRSSSIIALPPYFTTTILPWYCFSHGSASARVRALAWSGLAVEDSPLVESLLIGRS